MQTKHWFRVQIQVTEFEWRERDDCIHEILNSAADSKTYILKIGCLRMVVEEMSDIVGQSVWVAKVTS